MARRAIDRPPVQSRNSGESMMYSKRFKLSIIARAVQCAILAKQQGADPKIVWNHYSQ